jgi:hypothetical protein
VLVLVVIGLVIFARSALALASARRK